MGRGRPYVKCYRVGDWWRCLCTMLWLGELMERATEWEMVKMFTVQCYAWKTWWEGPQSSRQVKMFTVHCYGWKTWWKGPQSRRLVKMFTVHCYGWKNWWKGPQSRRLVKMFTVCYCTMLCWKTWWKGPQSGSRWRCFLSVTVQGYAEWPDGKGHRVGDGEDVYCLLLYKAMLKDLMERATEWETVKMFTVHCYGWKNWWKGPQSSWLVKMFTVQAWIAVVLLMCCSIPGLFESSQQPDCSRLVYLPQLHCELYCFLHQPITLVPVLFVLWCTSSSLVEISSTLTGWDS